MSIHKLSENVTAIMVQDWDRRLFDELIPLPHGTSYNSYLVRGSAKTALVDAADTSKEAELTGALAALAVKKLDYVVCNHAEGDHAGLIPALLVRYPEAKVVTNEKCKGMLHDLFFIPEERFHAIGDGDTLDLGGRRLVFHIAPWVHWPETMFTLCPEERTLFTCDFLGSHLATSQVLARPGEIGDEAKRYYAQIMMPFRPLVKRHLEWIQAQDVGTVAPSHGPVHADPSFIVGRYRDWSSDDVKNEVVIPWISMHGSTDRMVKRLVDALIERGVEVKPFRLTTADLGELAMAVVDAATIVLAAPTVLIGPHPQGLYAAALLGALKPKTRHVGMIGSYGWGSKALEQMEGLLAPLKAERLPPVYVKGAPSEATNKAIDDLAGEIASRHRSLGILPA